MKFLVDAQLPRRMARLLIQSGHDAIHTLDLPLGNRTPDGFINEIAQREERVVVTKDADFVNSFLLHGIPPKLLLVSTGNISNKSLENILARELSAVIIAFATNRFVEIDQLRLTIHV